MLQPNTFYRTSIKALIFDEHKRVLLAKEEGSDAWDLPGGGMNWGETPQVCLAREIQEELGISTSWIADHPSYFYSQQSPRGVWFSYALYEAKLEHLNFTPSDECTELAFFSLEEAKSVEIRSNVVLFFTLYSPARHKN